MSNIVYLSFSANGTQEKLSGYATSRGNSFLGWQWMASGYCFQRDVKAIPHFGWRWLVLGIRPSLFEDDLYVGNQPRRVQSRL